MTSQSHQWQLKRLAAICSHDAKSCYNLIGHMQASIAMQRLGVPKVAALCLFTMLQEAAHQVGIGFGDSTIYYGGSFHYTVSVKVTELDQLSGWYY
jgi:hypothetical protein